MGQNQEKQSLEEIKIVSDRLAERRRVDCYDHPEHAGLEPGDLYLNAGKRDVRLYVFDHDGDVAHPHLDTRIGTFVGTKRALFHFELNANFTPMTQLVVPSAYGLRMQYRNEHTFFRSITTENVLGLIDVLELAMDAKLIRRKAYG
jgi:hypothetical protein